MKRLMLAIAFMLAAAPLAHAADTTTTFATVDSYKRVDVYDFEITGLVSGEATPRTVSYSTIANDQPIADNCERAAYMMMNRPGRFNLEASLSNTTGALACRLIVQKP
jgi:hypothetical protein